jgi:hypothetical protein
MNHTRTLRNVAIIVVIAAAIHFLPGGGRAASAFEAALWVAFAIGFGYLALRFYREHRVSIHGLGDRHRGLLYGAVAIGLFEWAGRARMWQTGLGELVWFALLGLAAYALLEVYRHWRAY